MKYFPPEMVVSPKGSVSDLRVIYDGKEGSWSLATLKWNGNSALGIRWNSAPNEAKQPGPSLGNPQSRGIPTWFILPEELHEIVLKKAKKLSLN